MSQKNAYRNLVPNRKRKKPLETSSFKDVYTKLIPVTQVERAEVN